MKDDKKTFDFSQDRWVKTILTDRFEVEASSYEEAVSIIKDAGVKDLRDSDDDRIRFIETDNLDEEEEDISLISFTESCGKPTITVYGNVDGSIYMVKKNNWDEFRNGAS